MLTLPCALNAVANTDSLVVSRLLPVFLTNALVAKY